MGFKGGADDVGRHLGAALAAFVLGAVALPHLLPSLSQSPQYDTPTSSAYYQEYMDRFASPSIRASNASDDGAVVSARDSVLFVIDMQRDFDERGGLVYTEEDVTEGRSPCASRTACLPVRESGAAADAIVDLLGAHEFASVIASMDAHPSQHVSIPHAIPSAGCDANFSGRESYHDCRGTRHRAAWAAGGSDRTLEAFPPHAVAGTPGSGMVPSIAAALARYPGEVLLAAKGSDANVDSFGAVPYTRRSFEAYERAGLLDPRDPHPAQLLRSMLTWEREGNEGDVEEGTGRGEERKGEGMASGAHIFARGVHQDGRPVLP